jgi:hypothetical protein
VAVEARPSVPLSPARTTPTASIWTRPFEPWRALPCSLMVTAAGSRFRRPRGSPACDRTA